MNSLYIHIPFCASFCDYCDFYSVKAENESDALMDTFLSALITDIKYQLEFFNVKKIETAYIGGGTPSVLGAKRIRVLLNALKNLPSFTPQEFTIEANPESADEEFLSVLKEGGVNRLSLGVQSFHEPSRMAVNRPADIRLLEERLALASRYFPGAFSADLISGLPYQTEKIAVDDVKRLLAFAPSHVSLYSLTLEKGTALYQNIKSKKIKLGESEEADALWLSAHDALENEGFEHYEVSNFARPGCRCLHNIGYWRMEGWLGAGPAASGTIINEEAGTARRFTYAPDLARYNEEPSIHAAICEELDRTALVKESFLMGYRYREGPDAQKFKRRFGLAIEDCIGRTLARWKDRDIMLFLNSFLAEAFLELEEKQLFI